MGPWRRQRSIVVEPRYYTSACRVEARLIRVPPGWGPGRLLLASPYFLFPFGFSSGCGSFLRPDVFAGSGQQLWIGPREGLVQGVGKPGLLQTFLEGRHGYNLVEVGDLQGGRVETGHKILQRFFLPLYNGEESVGVSRPPDAGAEMRHEHLLQLLERRDALGRQTRIPRSRRFLEGRRER